MPSVDLSSDALWQVSFYLTEVFCNLESTENASVLPVVVDELLLHEVVR